MGTSWRHLVLFAVIMLGVAALLRPTNFRAGWMLLKSGAISEAIERLSQVQAKDPDNWRTMEMLAGAFEEQGNTSMAREYFEKVVSISPSDKNFAELVRFYQWTETPKLAKNAYERWYMQRIKAGLHFYDDDGRQILNDLYAYEMLYQDYVMAIDVLKTFQKNVPSEAKTVEGDIINLYEMVGDLNATVAYLEELLRKDDNNSYALDKFVEIAKFAGKTNEVRGLLVKDMEKNPKNEKAWRRFINFETDSGNLAAASALYVSRFTKDPGNLKLKSEYVNWLISSDQQRVAIAFLEKDKDPAYRDTLIKLYEWNNMREKLLPVYMARFEQNPDDRENAQNLVWTLVNTKQYDKAERVLKKLVSLYPSNAQYTQLLVDMYDKQNDDADAIQVLEKAVRVNSDPKLLKALGERYLWSKEKGKQPNP